MKSLLEQLPSIVANGKRKAEQILERLESNYRIGLQTREIVMPSRDTNWRDFLVKAERKDAETDPAKMNRLIYGDNLLAMAALLAVGGAGGEESPSMRGKIDLIYIDPPFDSKADYRTKINLPNINLEQKPTVIEQFAYADTWRDGTASYLEMIVPRLIMLRELLSDQGSIYVHIDWHVGHYVKILLDDIFGKDNFMNEIVWKRDSSGKGAKGTAKQWSRENDSILVSSKSSSKIFKQVYFDKLTPTQLKEYIYSDPDGRRFKKVQLGDYSEKSIQKFRDQNLIGPRPLVKTMHFSARL